MATCVYTIVLPHFADERVADGASPEEAVYEAAIVPILVISLAAIAGALPMALGLTGRGTDQPLAIAIVGGVTAATLLPKFIVPCLYALLKRSPRPETASA